MQIKIYCVSYVCLHYSALNGKVATLSREGKVRGVQTERGETSEGGSVQGGNALHSLWAHSRGPKESSIDGVAR